MKHPGPWLVEWLTVNPPRAVVIVDGSARVGKPVLYAHPDRREFVFADLEAERLILAAPELLAALKKVLSGELGARTPAEALIDRIEKG